MLYHYTNEKFSELIPQLGDNPKDVYDPKPCIWLTSSSNGYNGQIWKYKYIINVNDLCKEKLKEYDKTRVQTRGSVRWFRYFGPIKDFKLLNINK